MTPIQLLKILRKGFICLIIWNLLITGFLFNQSNKKQEEKINEQICNLELIPADENPVPKFVIAEELN